MLGLPTGETWESESLSVHGGRNSALQWKMTAGIPGRSPRLGGRRLQCSPSECLMVSFEWSLLCWLSFFNRLRFLVFGNSWICLFEISKFIFSKMCLLGPWCILLSALPLSVQTKSSGITRLLAQDSQVMPGQHVARHRSRPGGVPFLAQQPGCGPRPNAFYCQRSCSHYLQLGHHSQPLTEASDPENVNWSINEKIWRGVYA